MTVGQPWRRRWRSFFLLLTMALGGCVAADPYRLNLEPALMPIRSEVQVECPDLEGRLPPVDELPCSVLQWQAFHQQWHGLSIGQRPNRLFDYPAGGLAGRFAWALAYSQPDSPDQLRMLAQDSLRGLHPILPEPLQPFVQQLMAVNARLLDASAQQEKQRRVLETNQRHLIALRQQLAEKIRQIEALTDIESRLSPPNALPQGILLQND